MSWAAKHTICGHTASFRSVLRMLPQFESNGAICHLAQVKDSIANEPLDAKASPWQVMR
jgi:hypothetical protein